MKKVLLGTSALLAFTGVAFAGEAPKLTITGGVAAFFNSVTVSAKGSTSGSTASSKLIPGTTVDQPGNNISGHDIYMPATPNEIHFKANGKTDSGLTYGSKIEFRPLNGGLGTPASQFGPATDEADVYIGGDWGQIRLGLGDGAAEQNYSGGYSVMGISYDSALGAAAGFTGASNAGVGKDANGIVYFSPNISGFTFGVSYAPSVDNTSSSSNSSEGGSTLDTTPATPKGGGYNGLTELQASYKLNAGDASVLFDAGYARAKNDDKRKRDWSGTHAGIVVNYGDIGLGVGYTNRGKSNAWKVDPVGTNVKTIDFGASYKLSGNLLYAGYAKSTQGVAQATLAASFPGASSATTATGISGNGKSKSTFSVWAVGVQAPIADGLVADLMYNQTNNYNNGTKNSAGLPLDGKNSVSQVLAGMRVSF